MDIVPPHRVPHGDAPKGYLERIQNSVEVVRNRPEVPLVMIIMSLALFVIVGLGGFCSTCSYLPHLVIGNGLLYNGTRRVVGQLEARVAVIQPRIEARVQAEVAVIQHRIEAQVAGVGHRVVEGLQPDPKTIIAAIAAIAVAFFAIGGVMKCGSMFTEISIKAARTLGLSMKSFLVRDGQPTILDLSKLNVIPNS